MKAEMYNKKKSVCDLCGHELDGQRWVVACYGPRCWDAIPSYVGIENDFGNLAGSYACKYCAKNAADRQSQ
jgi:hypothetical protein